jgi:hypothetical protein
MPFNRWITWLVRAKAKYCMGKYCHLFFFLPYSIVDLGSKAGANLAVLRSYRICSVFCLSNCRPRFNNWRGLFYAPEKKVLAPRLTSPMKKSSFRPPNAKTRLFRAVPWMGLAGLAHCNSPLSSVDSTNLP